MKRESVKVIGITLLTALLFFPSLAQAINLDKYDDCNWLVTYRGRTYDLAPLTREALARPIESDLRYALQRVPEADANLKSMSRKLHDARAHTVLASAFVSGLVLTRVLGSSEKNVERKRQYDLISLITGAFFIKATFESYSSTREAKADLVRAVEAFNERSPHKIEPVGSGDPTLSAP